MIRAFIFDLDGVLTNTDEYHFQAWKRLADQEGIPFTREDNEALRGLSRRRSLEWVLKGRPVCEEIAADLMERKNTHYLTLLHELSPAGVLPGARELLHEIRASGMKIGVASSSKNAAFVIDRLELVGAIDVLCDGSSVPRPKPAPDLFLYAARQLGISPGESVVLEDAAVGIQAALAAGMSVVGLGPVERVGEANLVLSNLENCTLESILTALK